jgi:hypothetical protein
MQVFFTWRNHNFFYIYRFEKRKKKRKSLNLFGDPKLNKKLNKKIENIRRVTAVALLYSRTMMASTSKWASRRSGHSLPAPITQVATPGLPASWAGFRTQPASPLRVERFIVNYIVCSFFNKDCMK